MLSPNIPLSGCILSFVQKDKTFIPFQKKEPVGADDALPDSVTSNLADLTKEACEPLTVTQIKRIRALIDDAVEKVIKHLQKLCKLRPLYKGCVIPMSGNLASM